MHPRMAFAVAALVLAAACGGTGAPPAQGAPGAGAQRVDPATAGTVTGRVVFEGTPPQNSLVRMSGDPQCRNEGEVRFENYVVTDGGLDNVFVHVKDGLGSYDFGAPAEPVKLDQQGCRYVPHVLGVRTGQPLKIKNSDATMHNVHAAAEANRAFNMGQPLQNQVDTRTFAKAEVMVPFKCDVHGWMLAYVGVLDHPYFSVTRDGGRFELKGVPAGTYTIEAWHEKLGVQTQKVTLADKQTAEVTFTFKAPAAAGN